MICVVPARGGSKGLVGKNLRLLAGKPLIVHALECACSARAVSRVIVSTDDREIAEVAERVPGVTVPFLRPAPLASDDASAIDVYLHAAEWLNENGFVASALCALLPTTPLRLPADVDGSIAMFRARNAAVVLSVVAAKPAAWQEILSADARLSSPPGAVASVGNRQEYGKPVFPNGAVYVLDIATLASSRSYFGPNTYGYLMPSDRSIDIDGEDDLRIAEALMRVAA